MKTSLMACTLLLGILWGAAFALGGPEKDPDLPLGLPPVPIPENNPQTPAKIELGDKLFTTNGSVRPAK